MSKFPEIRGLAYCTRVARAQCTTKPRVMDQRKAFVELHQYAKFCVASSKFLESKGAYAYTLCTCIARALCTLSRNDMYRRITLIEFHKCTKFGVNRSKFPRTGGPLPNKLFSGPGARSLHLKGTVTTKAYMLGKHTCNLQVCISRAYRVACRGGKRTTGAKHLHVHCTCTMHPSPFLHTAPSRPCQGAPMYRVWCR